MKPLLIAVGVAGLLLGLISISQAQQSERIYPFVELTDEDVALIDIKDGSIGDWEEVMGEPTLTALDFRTDSELGPYDPVSMDFRIWLAWHDATNHIYVAMERADDVYVNEYGTEENDIMSLNDSYILFFVDGDLSGGEIFPLDWGNLSFEEQLLLWHQQAQGYEALAEVYDKGPLVRIPLPILGQGGWSRSKGWFMYPPYVDGGGRVFGEHPTISVTEFYGTPFDRFVYVNPEESVVSDLYPGKIIGFTIGVIDIDTKGGRQESIHYLRAEEISEDCGGWSLYPHCSDGFSPGFLLGPGGEIPESAVESDTWGRIKAQFVE